MFISKVGLPILLAMASIKHVEPTCTITVQDDDISEVGIDSDANIVSRVPKRTRKGRTPRRDVDVDVSDCSNESDDDGFIAIVKNGKKSDFKVTKSKKKKKKKNSSMDEDVGDESSPIVEKTFLTGEDANGNFVGIVKRNDGKMVGSIVDVENNEIVQITYDDDGKIHALVKSVDEFPPEGHAHTEDMDKEKNFQKPFHPERFLQSSNSAFDFSSSNMANLISRNTAESENTIIDVLVAWTRKAECFQSGKSANCSVNDKTKGKMEDLIDLAVLETNQAYQESGVSIKLELAHTYRSSITEASSDAFSKALSGIRYDEEAKSLREQYAADVVALIIEDRQYCGLGYIGPRKDLMFSVTARSCATGYYSFGHEIGHNMGLRHDLGTENACSASSSNYGWRDPDGNFRTIMGYNCRTDQCDKIKTSGCTRIPRFSTPRLSYEKKPLGSTGKADNAAYLNANKDIVAGYFMEAGTCIEDSHCEQPSEQCFINSCESGTCTMENWCETRKNVCGSGKGWVEIDVLLDKWPQEVSWSLEKNNAGVMYMQGSNDDINMPLGTKEYNIRNFDSNDKYVCLDNGNYKFTIYDSYGDGLSSPGYFKILYEGMESEINGIGNYGSSATHHFTLGPQESSTTSPTASATATTDQPSALPSSQPSDKSAAPSLIPSNLPTVTTDQPSALPSSQPSDKSAAPSLIPSNLPTVTTDQPSALPSSQPSDKSAAPSLIPSNLPIATTDQPSVLPSSQPSDKSAAPSLIPSNLPTATTDQPSALPSSQPSDKSAAPSLIPSNLPTVTTDQPSVLPSSQLSDKIAAPSLIPSNLPIATTDQPSVLPSSQPSDKSAAPSLIPSNLPTATIDQPSVLPSSQPSDKIAAPSLIPSNLPIATTDQPSVLPSSQPSDKIAAPSLIPSNLPTATTDQPSVLPSSRPSHESAAPSLIPSNLPTATIDQPSVLPSSRPSHESAAPSMIPSNLPTTSSPTTFPTIEVVSIVTNPSTEMPTLDERAVNFQKCKSEQWKRYTKANEKKSKCKSLQKALQKKCKNNADEKKCKKFVRRRCKNDGNATEICPHTCQLQCFIQNI